MDGYELALAIHENEAFEDLKMLLMTSSAEFESSQALLSLGLSGYFTKPVTPSDLHDALLLVLDQDISNEEQQPVITSGYLRTLSREQVVPVEDLSGKLNVLLVEDNPINRMIVHGMLDAVKLTCTEVENGQLALDYLNDPANHGRVNLILMDCQMPVLDGYQTTESIRQGAAGEWAKDIPIIAMTAHALQGDKEKCLACGMNDFITKPVNEAQFHKALEKWASVTMDAGLSEHTQDEQDESIDSGAEDMNTARVIWPDNLTQIDPGNPPAFANFVPQFIAALKVFVDKGRDDIHALQSDFSNQQFAELGKRAHGLKGSTGNLGFMVLSHAAAEIEQAVKTEQAISALQMTTLKELYDKALLDAQAIIAANTAEKSESSAPWQETAVEIVSLLEESQLVGVELINALQQSDAPEQHLETIKAACEQLNNFEYDEALKLLQSLMAAEG
jgi:CheY-like chemotaxis protein